MVLDHDLAQVDGRARLGAFVPIAFPAALHPPDAFLARLATPARVTRTVHSGRSPRNGRIPRAAAWVLCCALARVLVTRTLPEGGLDPLVEAGYELVGPPVDDEPLTADELAERAAQVDGIVCVLTDRIDETVLRAGSPRLKVVADVAVGYDNIDVASASELGIAVCNTPGVLDETTADLAFFLVLAAARRTSDAGSGPAGGALARVPDEPLPRAGRARCDPRRGGIRSYRPSGRAARRRLRDGGHPPHAHRHRHRRLAARTRRVAARRRTR